jgi:hypothetical protein
MAGSNGSIGGLSFHITFKGASLLHDAGSGAVG